MCWILFIKKKLQHKSHWTTLMSVLESVPITFSAISYNKLSSLLFHGDDEIDDTKHRKILT